MPASTYDAIVVGARCAGAALAAFLAGDGARVLVVDRDSLPSDRVLSTHTIHPPGIDVLDELGVGPALRSATPATRRVRLLKGDAFADVTFADGRAEYCPRRRRLDGLLQQAAVDAGAELRDRTRVEELVVRDHRVAGVRLRSGGTVEEIGADLVVGADGRHSTVAKRVGAEEYLGYDAPRAMYWAYWDAPQGWRSESHPFDMYLGHRDEHVRVVFQTDDGQLLIGSLPPVEQGRTWRGDPLASLRRSLAGDPFTDSLVDGATPDGKVRGTVQERYFFRRAAGPGWALVGDAGHHKDFVVGDGITEALLQARSLAGALRAEGEPDLVRWWRERDVRALPQYAWGKEEGRPGPPATLQGDVVRRVARDPSLQRRMTGLPEHRVSPYDALPMPVVLGCLARALLGGRFGAVSEFLGQGCRAIGFRRELAARRRLAVASRVNPGR